MPRKRVRKPGPYLEYLELLPERVLDATAFPYSLPALRNLTKLAFHPKVTFLIGENGSGKSTLIEAMAVAYGLNAEGGSRHFNFATRASHSSLGEAIRLVKTLYSPGDSYFLRAESFYNVATEIERLGVSAGYGYHVLHEESHGESFFTLFRERFHDNGLYFMDEPEAALSPQRQLQFLTILHDYVKRGGQFIIATHSPIIMAYPDAVICRLDSTGIRETCYTETEHYRITSDFLANPARSLRDLLGDGCR